MSVREESPAPGWVRISQTTLRYLRAAGFGEDNGFVLRAGVAFAPAWAEAIATVEGVSERMKMCALRKAARDPDVQPIVSTLVACLDGADRKELVEQLGAEFAQTLVCACGRKFESASVWRDHTEFECPKRRSLHEPET